MHGAAAAPALLLAALGLAAGRADGPRDNEPGSVRPVPPPGIALSEADRVELEAGLAALGHDIEALGARPEAVPLLPDVEIYRTAVRTAVVHDEFFTAEDIAEARTLLATGRERARALAIGQTPWLVRPGPTALGYVSRLDGSVQPYGLFIPGTWTGQSPGRWRLDAWFHGRGETLSEVSFLRGVTKGGGPFVRPDTFVLQPYGRYCNGSKFAGEVDFFEALNDVKRRFRIDEDRVVIRGFSLGGASVWHLAAHYASEWAAAAPGAGFAETEQFLRAFQSETPYPTAWERALWQLYDAPPYAENFRNLPVVAYSGEIDRQKQAADLMEKALLGLGIALTHVIGPGTAHKYHPDAIAAIDQRIDALAALGRDPMPRRVTLVTPTLKYNRQAWVTADALGRHWEPARVEAEIASDTEVRVRTRNVTALTLAMPSGRCPLAPGRATVVIDGQKLAAPAVASDRSFTAAFHQAGGVWVAGEILDHGLRKRHDLQGPIDDAFMGSFLIVTPSGEPQSPGVAAWVAAEAARAIREWRRQFRGEPRVKRDVDVTDADAEACNLALWGDPGSNRVLAAIAARLPIAWGPEEIAVGARLFPSARHALIAIYPNPVHPRRYVVLNSGFTFREYDYLNNARQVPRLPDWAVVDVTTPPDSRWPGRVAGAGFFGEAWELAKND